MDVLEILADDHRRAHRLFERLLEPGAGIPLRRHLFAELQRELELHSRLEEDLFYPAAIPAEQDPEQAHARSDHRTVAGRLALLDACPLDTPLWHERLVGLRDAVAQHIAWEEAELFPAAGRRLSSGERRRLAEQLQDERDRLTGLRGSVDDLTR